MVEQDERQESQKCERRRLAEGQAWCSRPVFERRRPAPPDECRRQSRHRGRAGGEHQPLTIRSRQDVEQGAAAAVAVQLAENTGRGHRRKNQRGQQAEPAGTEGFGQEGREVRRGHHQVTVGDGDDPAQHDGAQHKQFEGVAPQLTAPGAEAGEQQRPHGTPAHHVG